MLWRSLLARASSINTACITRCWSGCRTPHLPPRMSSTLDAAFKRLYSNAGERATPSPDPYVNGNGNGNGNGVRSLADWAGFKRQASAHRSNVWQSYVIYQIYPRSFCDSNGDGVGDLRGILSKLDYLRELGVQVIWLSPVYKSPKDDGGYDISDYRAIDPEYGTMQDFDELLSTIHAKGMKLLMDLVVNHCSDEHFWFQEARKSKDNPYRDYFYWRKTPNNWLSFFGGSAWEFDEATGEYYLHLFSKKQPDLNWENPKVREEIFSMMRFWLDKGIDGFRMDVINVLSKSPGLPDAPPGPESGPEDKYHWGGCYFFNGPHLMEWLQEMNEKVLCKYDVITVGETPSVTTAEGLLFTHQETGVVDMLFQFELMGVDSVAGGTDKWALAKWKLSDIKRIMSAWQNDLYDGGWNALYLENHDQPRSVSRFGDDGKYHKQSAKMLATWLHLKQGTPYIYQGQEIGMTNARFASIDDYRDLESLSYYKEKALEGADLASVMASIQAKSRDNARTPMQWSGAQPNAGFTTGRPWIRVNPNFTHINVEDERKDPDSIWNHYRKLIRMRYKYRDVILNGRYDLVMDDDPQIYAYTRSHNREKLLVVCNFSGEPAKFKLPLSLHYVLAWPRRAVVWNYEQPSLESCQEFMLQPWEVRVYYFSCSLRSLSLESI